MKFASGRPALYGSALRSTSGGAAMPRREAGRPGCGADSTTDVAKGRTRRELPLHERGHVGEEEAAARAALRQLRRPGERAVRGLRVVRRLPVRHVEHVGAEARMEAADRRPVEVAGERVGDRVVRGRRRGLPAVAVQQPAAGGVPVDHEREADPVEQPLERAGLRLRGGRRPAVGLAVGQRRGALLVVAPVVGEVAVRIHPVVRRDPAVPVVVAQRLAPQALGVERVLVAVRVGDEDEPQLHPAQRATRVGLPGAPAIHVADQQPPVDLRGDPLPRVLGGDEEDGRAAAVGAPPGAARELEREDRPAAARPPDRLELGDPRVAAGDPPQLVADAAALIPRPPHRVAAGRLRGGDLAQRPPVADARDRGRARRAPRAPRAARA